MTTRAAFLQCTLPLLVLAPNGHADAVTACPLPAEGRKSLPALKMTGFDQSRLFW